MNTDVVARPLAEGDLPKWHAAISRSETASGYFSSVRARLADTIRQTCDVLRASAGSSLRKLRSR